jgi:2-polyprenyl-3-methyl-5-hydroxy-6-metoxy-1,4-benzoquinol methylase
VAGGPPSGYDYEMRASRFTRSAVSRIEAASVVAGLRPYRPRYDVAPSKWDSEYASGALDHYGAPHERARYAVLVGYLRDLGPRTILDIGCGVGLLRGHIEHLDFEAYVGIDPSTVAIEAAALREFNRSTFEVGSTPTGSYDAIVCNEMLYYVDDLDDLLGRIATCLTPDGRLVTSIYKHPGDFALHRRLASAFRLVDAADVRNAVSRHRWKLAVYAVN